MRKYTSHAEKEEQIMQEKTAAVVLAAGKGKRMNSDVPKQFMLLRESRFFIIPCRHFRTASWMKSSW